MVNMEPAARMLQIMLDRGIKNTVLFVTREFGGSHLGPHRFLHIEKSARDALDAVKSEL